jgi:hypothetical protein
MANRAQLVIDLDLDATSIGGYIASDRDPGSPSHGWPELCAAIEARRTTPVTTSARTAPTATEGEGHRVQGQSGSIAADAEGVAAIAGSVLVTESRAPAERSDGPDSGKGTWRPTRTQL